MAIAAANEIAYAILSVPEDELLKALHQLSI
jgi:hypothetical protein